MEVNSIAIVVVVSWAIVLVVSGALALHGGRSWPAIVMIVGGVCQALGVGGSFLGNRVYDQAIATAMASRPIGSSGVPPIPTEHWGLGVMQVGEFVTIVGLLAFLVGLLPLCHRFGAMRKRVLAAEELNRQRQARLQEQDRH